MLEASAVASRLALYVVLLALFGAASYHVYAGRSAPAPSRKGFRLAAVAGVVVAGIALAVQAAQLTGSMSGAMDPSTHWAIITGMAMGVAWCVRVLALAAIVVLLAVAPASRTTMAVVAGLSGVALASLAWNGHGAGGEGAAGIVRLASTMAHLLAAGLWFGALILFLRDLAMWRRREMAAVHAGLAGFAGVGSLSVAVLLGTGLLNAYFLVGIDWRSMLTSLWGRLVLVKLALFVLMLALAAANRFRLTPALGRSLSSGSDHTAAVAGLRRSLVLETSAAVAVVALVAWLGTLSPTP